MVTFELDMTHLSIDAAFVLCPVYDSTSAPEHCTLTEVSVALVWELLEKRTSASKYIKQYMQGALEKLYCVVAQYAAQVAWRQLTLWQR